MRHSAGDSWRDTRFPLPRAGGNTPNYTGCTSRVENQGERRFLVLLPELTNTSAGMGQSLTLSK